MPSKRLQERRWLCLELKTDMPHRNIPIFIPHLGCPNQCVFCNQRSISGCHTFSETLVTEQIDRALATIPDGTDVEIAFFGGSFTGIDRDLMLRLLQTAQAYVDAGRVQGIRLSTRPDYITPEILELLSRFSVRVIELGLQSMDDGVLLVANRGHDASCAEQACRRVRDAGFSLVGQMMIGLPGSTEGTEVETARRISMLGAEAARIYPTVVFYDTPLCDMVKDGRYTPLSLDEAVRRSASALRIFEENGVECIRIGLCSGEELTSADTVLAGPNHPALGEMVRSELAYEKTLDALMREGLLGKDVLLRVPQREVSHIVGQHRSNLLRLERETDTRICKIVGDKRLQDIQPQLWQRV